MIRLLIVDDHALVRTGFRLILSSHADIELIGEAENGEDAVRLCRELRPDVLLMDMHLPGISGLEACSRILRNQPEARIIALTAQDAMPVPKKFLEAGALGFLSKACPAEELLRAIRRVASGGRYISPDAAQAIALEAATGKQGNVLDLLSRRETEVVMALAKGEAMGEIADRLHLSVKTIATHKYNACEKLGVHNDVELAHFAIQHGLVTAHSA
ncbi:hypothetical protein C7S18_16990 [Ahniella affigens]|uniref:DNA-binding response regulator n=1 Tax=Ahniella affigens TaxID=2021234 RepID=A0A2P1PVC0_9GAMM|nr:response regulator [Ahniella affigens]AVP98772.1 hypothetical protein C7S18_16990 [Ahniella affigens]